MPDIFNEIINNSTSGFLSDELRTSPRKMYINAKDRISFVRDKTFYNKMPKFDELKPGDWLLCYGDHTGYEFNGYTWELEAIIRPKNEFDKITVFSHIDNVPVTDINYTALYDELETLTIPSDVLKEIRKHDSGVNLNDYLYTDSVKFEIIDKRVNCCTIEKQSDLVDFFGDENDILNDISIESPDSLGTDFFDD